MDMMHGSKKIELTPETLADAAAVLQALSETLTETLEETLAESPELPEEEVREMWQLNEEAGHALMVGIAACKVLTDAMRKREEAGADDATAAQ
jgi:hypothetical protein